VIRAGSLDRVITIERATTTIGADGTPATTWATVATMRAELVRKIADEASRDFGAETTTTTTFRTRWLDGVTPADRVLYQGTAYDIAEATEIGRREGLDLRCQKRGQ
jgi:SPP1 family predicted phage head-tail adaptor